VRLCLIASKPTDSVILGFLPAAARLGLEVVLLTDKPEEHELARVRSRQRPRPGCPRPGVGRDQEGHESDGPPARIVGCDVWDARELICSIAGRPAQHAIVSNSDHLQTQTALAADYFGVPGKDWRSAMRAKNKSLMRRGLAGAGAEHVAAAEIRADGKAPDGLRYPVVLAGRLVGGVRAPGRAARAARAVRARDCLRAASAERPNRCRRRRAARAGGIP